MSATLNYYKIYIHYGVSYNLIIIILDWAYLNREYIKLKKKLIKVDKKRL